ncbi:hypothetical protein QUF74_01935 [Candidatus Halobeggiatoa sp. HSG11]|nr:hypothetical protein [Candidatus Halobeggiatoa sp. HSG11]
MLIKKLIGKIIIALIRASIRAFFGMLTGIAIVSATLMMLLFFGVLTPSVGSETMVFEIVGLLMVGACVGAVVGFFDMLEHRVIPNRLEMKNYHRSQ